MSISGPSNIFTDLGIPRFSEYWQYTALSAISAFALQHASPAISSHIFGQKFDILKSSQKYKWGVQLVSLVHAIVVCYLAANYLNDYENKDKNGDLAHNPIFGYSPAAEFSFSISIGYFIWDSFICLTNFKEYGLPFTLHAMAGLTGGFVIFRPLFQNVAAWLISFEVTTIFLNVYWFMDKLGMTGSVAQLVVAVGLILSYLGVRLLFGSYMFFYTLLEICALEMEGSKTSMLICYAAFSLTFSTLNFVWFFQIIRSASKRFTFDDEKNAAKTKKEL